MWWPLWCSKKKTKFVCCLHSHSIYRCRRRSVLWTTVALDCTGCWLWLRFFVCVFFSWSFSVWVVRAKNSAENVQAAFTSFFSSLFFSKIVLLAPHVTRALSTSISVFIFWFLLLLILLVKFTFVQLFGCTNLISLFWLECVTCTVFIFLFYF